jgi:hypothetical protein
MTGLAIITAANTGFMQVGHDQQTLTNYKTRRWFGLDQQL